MTDEQFEKLSRQLDDLQRTIAFGNGQREAIMKSHGHIQWIMVGLGVLLLASLILQWVLR